MTADALEARLVDPAAAARGADRVLRLGRVLDLLRQTIRLRAQRGVIERSYLDLLEQDVATPPWRLIRRRRLRRRRLAARELLDSLTGRIRAYENERADLERDGWR